jgi:septal ring factor EnvC (AmiA/AmiB activator)
MKRVAILFILLVIPAVCLHLSGVVLKAAPEKNNQQVKIREAEKKERSLLKELDLLERKIGDSEDHLVEIERDISAVAKKVAQGDKDVQSLNRRVLELKKYLNVRLRALYMLRDGGFLQILVSAHSIQDLVTRYRHLSLILGQDRKLLEMFSHENKKLFEKQGQLHVDSIQLKELKKRVARELATLVRQHKKKTELLMQVHQKKELYQAMIKQHEESHQRLVKEVFIKAGAPDDPDAAVNAPSSAVIRRVESPDKKQTRIKKQPPVKKWPDFQRQKGKIPWPVPGKITRRFGRSRGLFNTITERHGLFFQTKAGTNVKAVLNGEVIYTGWLQGYGNIIIIHHGRRYYTLTGGLSGVKLKNGQWVQKGDILGTVPKGGQIGKKDIYFEIRHGGRALNPSAWLGKKPAA